MRVLTADDGTLEAQILPFALVFVSAIVAGYAPILITYRGGGSTAVSGTPSFAACPTPRIRIVATDRPNRPGEKDFRTPIDRPKSNGPCKSMAQPK